MDIKELKDEKYHDAYSEEKLFDKILKFAKSAGIKLIYLALLLFYTLQKSDAPLLENVLAFLLCHLCELRFCHLRIQL